MRSTAQKDCGIRFFLSCWRTYFSSDRCRYLCPKDTSQFLPLRNILPVRLFSVLHEICGKSADHLTSCGPWIIGRICDIDIADFINAVIFLSIFISWGIRIAWLFPFWKTHVSPLKRAPVNSWMKIGSAHIKPKVHYAKGDEITWNFITTSRFVGCGCQI